MRYNTNRPILYHNQHKVSLLNITLNLRNQLICLHNNEEEDSLFRTSLNNLLHFTSDTTNKIQN